METKHCTKCGETKPIMEFGPKTRPGGRIGLQSMCKACHKAVNDANYAKNKDRYLRKQREETIPRNKKFINDYLLAHPCVDCGETDPVVLEFDHVRGEKVRGLSNFRTSPIKTIEAEIAKCEVRCANCHRRRHNREGTGPWRTGPRQKPELTHQ